MNNIKIPLTLTILSPVHIGSGNKAIVGQDVIIKENKAIFLSFDRIIQYYANDRRKIAEISDALSRGENVLRTIPNANLSKFVLYKIPFENNNVYVREISTFIKDAHGLPYIPATSLKGSLRTLILQEYLNTHTDKLEDFIAKYRENKRYRKTKIESLLFGSDAKKDLFKAVRIDDAYLSIKDISIKIVKVFDISNDGSRAGFRRSRGRSSDLVEISSATPIVVEAVRIFTKLKTALYIDKFTLEKSRLDGDKDWLIGKVFSNTYENLCNISKRYALREIKEEKNFLAKYGKNLKDVSYVTNYFDKLKEIVEKDNEAIYLRTGWGIGWKGMTGDYLSNHTVKNLHISKRDAVVFPKTRRFATIMHDGKEYALYPFGWTKLKKE